VSPFDSLSVKGSYVLSVVLSFVLSCSSSVLIVSQFLQFRILEGRLKMFWWGHGLLVLLVLSVLHILIANLAFISEVHIYSGPVNGCSYSFLVG